jgi:hypothetical protein
VKKWIIGIALLAAVVIAPRIAGAHEGHEHTVMGNITKVDGMNLMVKGADGKEVMVMMDAKTKITQGKAAVEAKTLKVGDRVVAKGAEEHAMIMATSVQLGTASPATAAKK